MHPAAWMAWVLLVLVVALATTNPLYLAVILLSVALVAALAPRTDTGVASFRALALFGVTMFCISVAVATINGSYGDHVLFTVPGPAVPKWLGGLRLGGPVSAEGLTAASIRGLAILSVLLAFGVFNGAVSPQRVLRSTPAALFHASLVVTVGLTLLPSSIEDVRRIREMRSLRGARGGLRDLPALVVPAVVGGLERSMRLAEAMEARGYASADAPPASARFAAAASAPLFVAASWLWFYESAAIPAAVLAFAGAAAIGWWLRAATLSHRTTRFDVVPIPSAERLAVAGSLAGAVLVVVLRTLDAGGFSYNPFAGLTGPPFAPAGAALALACAWPALFLALAAARVRSDSEQTRPVEALP